MGEEFRVSRPKSVIYIGTLLSMFLTCSAAAQTRPISKLPSCDEAVNARIMAADGTFLGSFSSAGQPDSILNKNGRFGSPSSPDSLWNRSGPYGSTKSIKSPMNPHGGRPAQLVKDGKVVGRLMQDSLRSWIEDPAKLIKRCSDNLG